LDAKAYLLKPTVNGWRLYLLVSVTLSLAIIARMTGSDMGTAEAVSALIAYSVRWSVPFLYLAFAASALHQLFRSCWTQWLLRNRRIIGLCFATAMAWQGGFINWLVVWHRDYYMTEVYVLRDAIEGLIGYAFLVAMTITSFKPWRKRMQPKQWKRLHTWGIYFLWAYAFSVYWHELFYYREPDGVDYAYYAGGLLAWSARLAAWCKRELKEAPGLSIPVQAGSVLICVGAVAVSIAVVGVISGSVWEGLAYQHLWNVAPARWFELYLPYWPFIPFLPLFVALGGAVLFIRGQRGRLDH
jgi:DMSO/TMAO reductase YedYZ heme-binding membrane subunit